MKDSRFCPEVDPSSGQKCMRKLDHKGDHYPIVGEFCWPNAKSPSVTVDFDTAELWTLWTVMEHYAPNHVRYGRINEKLTTALGQAGEDVP